MRRNIVILLSVTTLFSGCAYQGVVVEKRFRPVPFSASLGIDAMYNFQLRDSAAQVHSQMVTPDVFASYRTGDYFNDLQPAPAHQDKELEGFRIPPPELRDGPYQPVKVMQMRSPQRDVTKVAVQSSGHAHGDVKILRWQTVRVIPIQSPEMITAKVATHAPELTTGEVKIPRWQTVLIVPIQSPQKMTTKVAGHAPERTTGDVKILRWQTVRLVPIQSPEKITAKAVVPAHPRARSAVKTAASRDRNKHSAKIAQHKKKKAKVASKLHHKTIASVN